MYEVHTFVAYGEAREGNDQNYPVGERHPIVVFCRQRIHSDHDYERVEAVARRNGWAELEVAHAGVIVPERLNGSLSDLQDCFVKALQSGGTVLSFRRWVSN